MAKINFAALVDSIIGKLGGSVFQYSQGGWQVHVIGKPRNPQTNYQQLRRGNFGFLSSSWRNLTTIQRQSFIDNVPAGISALDFFIRTNVNLSLVDEPTVTTFIPAVAPDDFPVEITDVNPTQYMIKASGMTTVVPAGKKLLIYTTSTKAQTKIFTNPSEYSPIISLDEGTDLSAPINIIAAYNDRFGQLPGEMYLCNKTVLIDKINGQRGTESITCSNTDTMANKYIPLAVFTGQVFNVGAGVTDLYSYAMPANTLDADNQRLEMKFDCQLSAGIGAKTVNLNIDGTNLSIVSAGIVSNIEMRATLYRTGNTTARVSISVIRDSTTVTTEVDDIGVSGFNGALTIKWTGQASGSNLIEAKTAFIDKVTEP